MTAAQKLSQRVLHTVPIFRLLLKVAVNDAHQCDSRHFWGAVLQHYTAVDVCEEEMCVGKWGDYVWAAQKDYVLKKCSGQPRGGLSFQEPPLGCPEHFGALPTKGLACNTCLLSPPPQGGERSKDDSAPG